MAYTDVLFLTLFLAVFVAGRLLRRLPAIREWFFTGFASLLIASWGVFDLALFAVLLVVNYMATLAMVRTRPTSARRILIAAIAIDLVTLAVFKYTNFLGANISHLTGWTVPLFPLGIPLAVSFYTFHLISYLVDVYKGRIENTTFRRYIFYLTFFPHVIAGPIVRAWQLVPQVGRTRTIAADLPIGFHFLVTGLFLKVIAADNIAAGIDPIWAAGVAVKLSAADRWVVAFLYYCQIYADFAGYSLMALGMARLLGYRLPANFRAPMRATGLQEFWRRWHITLSRWLRDYLYIPLGGSRNSFSRTAVNIFITMLLGGLWHGAAWGFVLWGAMHGVGLVVERALRLRKAFHFVGSGPLAWLATQVWVTLAWVFFRAPDLNSALSFISGMANLRQPNSFHIQGQIAALFLFSIPVILHHAAPLLIYRLGRKYLGAALGIATGVMFVLCLTVVSPSKPFIYFRF